MNCSCQNEDLPAWRRPLLTQRKGYRQDGRPGRLEGSYVNGQWIADAADAGRALMGEAVDLCAGMGPGEVRRQNGNVAKTTQPQRKARDDAWQWGSAPVFGGGGNVRVGPGWAGDALRTDGGEVEVVIDGQRCIETPQGWRTADGEPCPLVEER
jgi:hypothetical protein